MRMNSVGGDRPMFGEGWERQEQEFDCEIRKLVKVSVNLKYSEEYMAKVQLLTKQGDFLSLAACERGDAVWKSFIYNMKK